MNLSETAFVVPQNGSLSKQLSERSSELVVKLVEDRVEIKGKAITFFEAKLK